MDINVDKETGYVSLQSLPNLGYFSSHFKVSELFMTRKGAYLQNQNYKNIRPSVILNLFALCSALEVIRHFLGDTALYINSGYRCTQLNDAVGGSPTSYHLIGAAADLALPETPHLTDFLKHLQSIGVLNEVLYHKHHYHISVHPFNPSLYDH